MTQPGARAIFMVSRRRSSLGLMGHQRGGRGVPPPLSPPLPGHHVPCWVIGPDHPPTGPFFSIKTKTRTDGFILFKTMASHHDEEEAGPSGLSAEEMRALLGLDTSEKDEEDDPSSPEPQDDLLAYQEVLGESDEDDLCNETMDRFERQRAFQPNSFNKVGEVWIPQWEPLSFISKPMWFDRVVAWGYANIISRPVHDEQATLLNKKILSVPLKTDYVGRWLRC